jgi:hypothetical protein
MTAVAFNTRYFLPSETSQSQDLLQVCGVSIKSERLLDLTTEVYCRPGCTP